MEYSREKYAAIRLMGLILFPFAMVMFLLVGGSSASASASKALLVVGGDSLGAGDKLVRSHLRVKGFEVVVKSDRNVTAANAKGMDLIVISESSVSTRLKNKFRKVSVPIICLDAYQYDDLGMTARDRSTGSKFGQLDEQQNVRIKADSHPLAVRLPAGQVVEVGQRDIIMSWGVPGKNAIKVASLVNSTNKFAIFAYEKGKKMPGLVAPARRVGFFLTSKAAKSATADGWKLFSAAVDWAIGSDCPDGYAAITFVNNCSEPIWIAELGNGASKKCVSNADCGVNGHDGNCTNGACAEILCEADADCGSDIQFCKQSNCKSNGDCPAVNCYTNADCPFWDDTTVPQTCIGGGACTSDNNCTAINCYSDADCPFSGSSSDPQTCIGGGLCQSNADCPAITCTTSADCPQLEGVSCDTTYNVCTPSCQPNGQCLCMSAAECPGAYATCQNNLCSKTVGYCSNGCRPGGQCACVNSSSSGLPVNPCSGGESCQADNSCSMPVGYCSAACRPGGQCACVTTSNSGLPVLACPGDATCGQETNLCSGVGLCTYQNLPSPGYWQLSPDGNNTKQICVPADNNDTYQRAWGGRFWARTGCPDNFATCKPEGAPCDNNTACCNNSCQGNICQPGIPACLTGDCKTALECQVSGTLPVSLFEVNYASAKVAYYDASLADSYNVPILATPITANCPAAGCTGNLNAMCPQLLQYSGTSCTTDVDCPAGGACEDGTCVVGCISACNQCQEGTNAVALQCDEVVPGGDGVTKFSDLYCCTSNLSCNLGAPTCFDDTDCAAIECQQNADCSSDNCTARGVCGGMTCDQSTYLCNPLPPNQCASDAECKTEVGYTCSDGACMPPSNCCGPYNPLWRTAMETYVTAFKEACPTAYSYQYDDPTSLFTCPNSGKGVDFTVTFCPK